MTLQVVDWTNKYSQKLPVYFTPVSETPDGSGLNPKNVVDAVDYASGAYKYKALPQDSLLLLHKTQGVKNKPTVVGELYNQKAGTQVNYVVPFKVEKNGILGVVDTIGTKLDLHA